jgi:hypothetical protein
VAPAQAPADEYDLAPGDGGAPPSTTVAHAQVLPYVQQAVRPEPRPGPTPTVSPPGDNADTGPGADAFADAATMEIEEEGTLLRHRYVPIALLVLGIAGRIWYDTSLASETYSPVVGLALGIADIVLNVAVMMMGVWMSAAFLGVNFGPILRVILKLCAFAAVTTTAGLLVAGIDPAHGARAFTMGLAAKFVLNCVFFGSFFDLDMQESTMTVAIITILQAIAGVVLWQGTQIDFGPQI